MYVCMCMYMYVPITLQWPMLNSLAGTLHIWCTQVKSKQQHVQGYGMAEVLQPQSCRSSQKVVQTTVYSMTSHTGCEDEDVYI